MKIKERKRAMRRRFLKKDKVKSDREKATPKRFKKRNDNDDEHFDSK